MKTIEYKLIRSVWFWLPMIMGILLFLLLIFTNTNKEVFFILNSLSNYSSPIIWSNLTVLGNTLVAFVLFLPLLRERNDLLWPIIFAAIASMLISHGLKHFLAIPRPPAILSKDFLTVIGPVYKRNSFPSGHATTIFTIASLLIFTSTNTKFRVFMFLSAALIALSRVAVGVHWPTDIIGGMLTGWFSSYLGLTLYSKIKQKLPVINFSIISGIILISAFVLLGFFKLKYPGTDALKNIVGILAIINIASAHMKRYEKRLSLRKKNKRLKTGFSGIIYRVDKMMTL